jgi:hypothetical protein
MFYILLKFLNKNLYAFYEIILKIFNQNKILDLIILIKTNIKFF